VNRDPIWRLLHKCALELTKAGRTPFSRGELIACVQRKRPHAAANSINPIIQGITDNLRGGAPGADGKRILHSVGRGSFVLLTTHAAENAGRRAGMRATPSAPDDAESSLPATEGELAAGVARLLGRRLRNSGCVVVREGPTRYRLPNGDELTHAADILVSAQNSARHVSIEVKYRSAVTDQFKCRSYDAMHAKATHGGSVLTVMLYAMTGTGISRERARSICYPFDRFYAAPAREVLSAPAIDGLASEIEAFLLVGPATSDD
jgi:hypothetical protein